MNNLSVISLQNYFNSLPEYKCPICGGKDFTIFSSFGFEVDKFVVPPGGFNGEIPMDFEIGDRVSIKQLNAEALGSGIMIVANFYK